MGGYFKPWRRKIGVVTLVMACVLMAGWVRSLTVADHIDIPRNNRLHMLNSRHGHLVYCQFEQDFFPKLQPLGLATQYLAENAVIVAERSLTPTPPMKWTTSSAVVDKFEGIENVITITHCGIDYAVKNAPRFGDLRSGQQFVF